MHTYFLSDLHLTPERPQITAAFLRFLETDALTAERIYLLGDLFEFWIGDDAADMLGAAPIMSAMHAVSQHVDCYFIAGNRDFLVRSNFTVKTGFKILPDESVIDLYGSKTLILHGDSLCADDIAHQHFRSAMMNNKSFCDDFLSLAIPERIEKAKQARMQSHEHKAQVSMEIMDVTENSVIEAFKKYDVQQMIHGHTHRQNQHKYEINKVQATRYVLGDWHTSTSIMKVDAAGLEISNQAIA